MDGDVVEAKEGGWWCGEKTENDPSDSRLKRGRGNGVVDKTTI